MCLNLNILILRNTRRVHLNSREKIFHVKCHRTEYQCGLQYDTKKLQNFYLKKIGSVVLFFRGGGGVQNFRSLMNPFLELYTGNKKTLKLIFF